MKRNRRKEDLEKLEREVEDLRRLASPEKSSPDLERLRTEVSQLRHEFYDHLGAWQRTLLARHPQRPYMMDYVRILFEDFHELHGDRAYGDDPAMIAGFAKYHGRPVAVIGQQKGRDTKQRVALNFGQAKPEGYRKALRVMHLAAKFSRPVLTFVDTPGAYPGNGPPARPHRRDDHRRRRLRRRAGHRRGRSRQYAREFRLFRNFPGGLRLDSVARFVQSGNGRGSPQDHGSRSEPTRHHRCNHPPNR